MDLRKMMFLCLLAGVFYACNQGRETNITVTPAEVSITPLPTPEATTTVRPENTKTPSVTEKPGNSPTAVPTEEVFPTPTPEPEGELIPIDEEHFTSAVFREYIAEYYDRNKDGYLSDSEQAAITEIYIGYSETEGMPLTLTLFL